LMGGGWHGGSSNFVQLYHRSRAIAHRLSKGRKGMPERAFRRSRVVGTPWPMCMIEQV
jgi:hypothetical protein